MCRHAALMLVTRIQRIPALVAVNQFLGCGMFRNLHGASPCDSQSHLLLTDGYSEPSQLFVISLDHYLPAQPFFFNSGCEKSFVWRKPQIPTGFPGRVESQA